MKTTSCEIHFPNNPSRAFHSGQTLSGLAVLNVTKSKTVKGIYVKIIGRAYCRWATGSGHHRKTNVGEELYLNEKKFVAGDDSGSEVFLATGQHNYTFSCMLPLGLPTSVEGNIGYIRYSVAVHVDKSLWSEMLLQQYFTVIKPLNLNDEIVLRSPLVKEERKSFSRCCLPFCCKSGPLIISGSVPVRGYAPGQMINLLLQIDNRSNQSIRIFIVQVVKHIQYHTHANSSTTKCDETVLKSFAGNGCCKSELKRYMLPIAVPSVPPTDESTSNIVKVSYRLQITGSTGCFHEDPVLSIPITIGTYPILLSNQATTQPTTESSLENFGNPPCSTPFVQSISSPSDLTDSVDPPAYEETI